MTDKEIIELEADYDLEGADTKMERAKAIVTLVIVCAVNIANVMGYAVDAEAWVNVALSVLSAISIIYAWWKNQNVTEQAVKAQVFLNALKREAKTAKHSKAA